MKETDNLPRTSFKNFEQYPYSNESYSCNDREGLDPALVLNTSSTSNSDPVDNSSSVDQNPVQGPDIRPSRRRKDLTRGSLNVNSITTKIDEIRLLVKI